LIVDRRIEGRVRAVTADRGIEDRVRSSTIGESIIFRNIKTVVA
jgi:hypothetical protein